MLAQELESRYENYLTEDAEILLVGYGIVSRVLRTAIDQLRAQGMKAGLFRPITLWPFPSRELCETAQERQAGAGSRAEHGNDGGRREAGAQRHAFRSSIYGRVGGNVPMAEEITAQVFARMAAHV